MADIDRNTINPSSVLISIGFVAIVATTKPAASQQSDPKDNSLLDFIESPSLPEVLSQLLLDDGFHVV